MERGGWACILLERVVFKDEGSEAAHIFYNYLDDVIPGIERAIIILLLFIHCPQLMMLKTKR